MCEGVSQSHFGVVSDLCRTIAHESGMLVISVDYRLAPGKQGHDRTRMRRYVR